MKILLLSDTHGKVDGRIKKYAQTVDEIWHAGDIGSIDVVNELERFAPVIAVHGNIDHGEVKQKSPEFLYFYREGVTILMTHIAGKPGRYSKVLREKLNTIPTPDVLVCGHSHILLVRKEQFKKFMWLNPGACGDHGFHKVKTMLRFDIEDTKLLNMEVIEFKR